MPLDGRFEQTYHQIVQLPKVHPFNCYSFDISTRKFYSPNHFYTPFHSIPLHHLEE